MYVYIYMYVIRIKCFMVIKWSRYVNINVYICYSYGDNVY